jgi:hypothetical protein
MLPSLSLAAALIAIVAGAMNVAPLAGEVIATVGGRLAAAVTVTATAVDTFVVPRLSVAFAVSEYEPAGTFVHCAAYGADVAVPTSVEPPRKNSTFATVPSGSDAEAARGIVAPAANVAPLAGEVSVTLGGWLGFAAWHTTTASVDATTTTVADHARNALMDNRSVD